jgi:MFS family permease
MSSEKEKIVSNDDIEQMEIDSEKIKLFEEKRKKYILKGLSSLLSSIINIFGYFSIWIMGNSIVYLISLRRKYNPNLTFSYGYFLIPIMDLVLCLASPIGGIIEDKIGGKKTIFLSTSIMCASFSLMYFSKNIFFDYMIMCLIGIGLAIGINITRKNVCSFFLNRKALISGILFLVPGFLCAFQNMFNEKYILNPLSESPTIDNLYYNEKIASNFQKLIISEIVLLIITCVFTLLLYFPNNPKETIKYGFGENAMKDNVKSIETTKNKSSKQMKLKKAIYNIRAVKLFIMIFLFFPTINFINITWRAIGIYYKINTYYLQMTGALYSITGCVSAIIFALIGDRIQFRILFVIFSFVLTVTSFAFPASFNYDIFFISEVLIMAFILRGYNIVVYPHILKVYGVENSIEIGGIIRSSEGICEILSIILAFYIENNFSGNKTYAFKLMYIISGCCNLISLILGLSESDDKFNYNI